MIHVDALAFCACEGRAAHRAAVCGGSGWRLPDNMGCQETEVEAEKYLEMIDSAPHFRNGKAEGR